MRILLVLTTFLWLASSELVEGASSVLLIERLEEASLDIRRGSYPNFVDRPALSGSITLMSQRREAITPPFPGRLSFDIELPPAAFLDVFIALAMEQMARRARVEFLVQVEEPGRFPVAVFSDVLRLEQANRWHHHQIRLTDWSGKRVRLVLETRGVPAHDNILWAARVQTVWGDPVVVTSRPEAGLLAVRDWLLGLESWITRQARDLGLDTEQQDRLSHLVFSLLIGGFLSIYVRELYKRFAVTLTHRERLANMFPVFTLTTIVVVYVVQSSLALALGLIGALSVVRFRTAIKNPEELVYLFFCIALGLTLGAYQLELALVAVVLISLFVFLGRHFKAAKPQRRMLLTASAELSGFYESEGDSAVDVITNLTKEIVIERLDRDSERVRFRAIVTVEGGDEEAALLSKLRIRLPRLEVSLVDLE